MKLRFLANTIILCTALYLSGCLVYKADVQQGNDITAEMVSQLTIGMTRREVTRIVGFPLINDPFHKNRWDYYYSLKNGKTGEVERQSVSLTFSDDLLGDIASSFD